MLLRMIWSILSPPDEQHHATEAFVSQDARALGQRVSGNALWLLSAQLGTLGLMLLFTVVLAQRLGEVGLGSYAFMVAVIFFGNTATTFGTDMLIIREVAARGDLSLLPAALRLQLFLSALFIGLVFLGAPALPNQSREAVQGLQLYSLALLPMSFYTVFSAALRGYERMNLVMWLTLALAVLQVGLTWFFIRPASSLVTLASLLLATHVGVASLAAYFCLTQIPDFRSNWQTSGAVMPALLRASAPIASLALLKVLYQKLSVYMLSTYAGAAATGWFSAALRPIDALQIGHIALLGALFPVMVQKHAGRKKESRTHTRIFSISWWLLLTLGILGAAILFLLAPLLVQLLYGSRFEPTIPALRLLAWTLIPYSVNIYLSSDLLSAGNERQVAFAFMLSLLVLAGLSGWWIPRWGLLGACLARLSAETIQAAIFLYLSKFRSNVT